MGLLSPWTIIELVMLVVPVVVAFTARRRLARPGLVLGGAVLMSISGAFSLIRLVSVDPSAPANLQLIIAFSSAAIIFTGILPVTGAILMIFGAMTKAATFPTPVTSRQDSAGNPIGGLPTSVQAPPAPQTWQQPTQTWR